MLLLAFDTSGREGGIALARCEADACEILEEAAISGGMFSAQLVPQVSQLLCKHNFFIDQIDVFAVATGPGSFTGLRIGLAAAMGFAEALQKPIVAISVLQAMTWDRGEGTVIAALDASRNEAYVGYYRDRGRTLVREMLMSQSAFAELCMKDENRSVGIVACDDSILALIPSAQRIERPSPADFARIGWSKFRIGETVSVSDLDANYIRRTDAEIFSK